MVPTMPGERKVTTPSEPTFYTFPTGHAHGWSGKGKSELVAFHHTVVPKELEEDLPTRGYYQIAISKADCERLRHLARIAREILDSPTARRELQTQSLVTKFSLLALREITMPRVAPRNYARAKTEQAITWYREHLAEAPGYDRIAGAMNVSPAHLRYLFHVARNKSCRAGAVTPPLKPLFFLNMRRKDRLRTPKQSALLR